MAETFNFYSDPGHGWLRVRIEWLIELGIYEAISEYSYVSDSGRWVYLEEDLDALIFNNAVGAHEKPENGVVRIGPLGRIEQAGDHVVPPRSRSPRKNNADIPPGSVFPGL